MRVDTLTEEQKTYVRRAIRRGEGEYYKFEVWEVEGEGDDETDVRRTYEHFIGKMSAEASIRVMSVLAVAATKGANLQQAMGKEVGFNPLLLLRMLDSGLANEFIGAVLDEPPQWVAARWDLSWALPVVAMWAKYQDFLALKDVVVSDVLPLLGLTKKSE